jgi:quercetin dioxygenase-like cupin family protein
MTHDPVNDLHALSDELLETARASSSGRAARTVFGQAHQTLHQTLIALLAGQGLAEHGNPGQATVQVLRGSLTLDFGSEALHGSLGALLAVPERDHSLTAVQDTVLLLTVAKLEH